MSEAALREELAALHADVQPWRALPAIGYGEPAEYAQASIPGAILVVHLRRLARGAARPLPLARLPRGARPAGGGQRADL